MTAYCSTIGVAHPLARRCDPWARARQFLCGLTGHDSLLVFDGSNRLALRCQLCGHESPGFDNSDLVPATRRYEGDHDRHALPPRQAAA